MKKVYSALSSYREGKDRKVVGTEKNIKEGVVLHCYFSFFYLYSYIKQNEKVIDCYHVDKRPKPLYLKLLYLTTQP